MNNLSLAPYVKNHLQKDATKWINLDSNARDR